MSSAGVVAAVDVEGDGAGCLVVRWVTEDGAPREVDIAVGPTPETVDHAHVERVPAGTTATRLTDLGPGRHYVSVSPAGEGGGVIAAERLVPMEGVPNFRDLGGYPSAFGGRTRWGRVFRSAGLHQVTLADRVAFEHLGIRVVYDLRRDDEREHSPSAHEPIRAVPLSLMSSHLIPTEPDGVAFLREAYRMIVDESAHHLGTLLAALADPDGVPALFHCAAGKDRTGVAAAMLLSVLGVPDEHVLDDYALTERHLPPLPENDRARAIADGWHPGALDTSGSAPPQLMAEVLDRVRQRHGSVEAYLVEAGGMDVGIPDELRRLLLDR